MAGKSQLPNPGSRHSHTGFVPTPLLHRDLEASVPGSSQEAPSEREMGETSPETSTEHVVFWARGVQTKVTQSPGTPCRIGDRTTM